MAIKEYVEEDTKRVGYPDIVTYLCEHGQRHICPPMDGRKYETIVHDQRLYDALGQTGFWNSNLHRGRSVIVETEKGAKPTGYAPVLAVPGRGER